MGARTSALMLVASVACGDSGAPPVATPAGPSALEAAIAADLGGRVGAPVVAHCVAPLGFVVSCRVHLPDGSSLPVALHDGGSAWEWAIDGRVVTAAPVEAYVRDVLGDLGVTQGVVCGPALQRLPPDARVDCRLSGGGAAFVAIGSDGAMSVELALDPATAAARREPVTRARERELDSLSRALAPHGSAAATTLAPEPPAE